MSRDLRRTLIQILIWSLLVGLVLSLLDITPWSVLRLLGETTESVFRWVVSVIEWAIPYVLLGAIIVVPIVIAIRLIRFVRGRR